MFEWIVNITGFEPIVIATKLDKIKRSQVMKQIENIRKKFNASKELTVIPFSSETKQGKENVYEIFDNILKE